MENTCCPKTIFELCDYNFYIPEYQRGYRWSIQQVNELLDDIWDFSKGKQSSNEFYCLQPIIVKKININNQEFWEVIDGQQRLTTIHIILSYLNSMLPEKEKQFNIKYATRDRSMEFLESINEKQAEDNIDFFHIYNAYKNIKNWLNLIKESEKLSINALIMKILPVFSQNVKVIWYEVDPNINSVEVFTRVNMGKIPLTNAELIKALLLKKSNFGSNSEMIRIRQLEIASEWDRIEYALQNEDFWYFLTNGIQTYENRIDFIFKLMADQKNKEYNIKIIENDLLPFHVFSKWFSEIDGNSPIELLWKEIKDYFLTFDEWYQDKNLYHLVGFLITIKKPISSLKSESLNKTKDEFINYLNSSIQDSINYKKNRKDYLLEDLTYATDSDRDFIKKILLLFNVITVNKNNDSNSRFPFKSYKKEQWDLEHIHSVKSQIPERINEQEVWLNEAILEVKDNSIYEETLACLKDKKHEMYDILIDKILNYLSENNSHEDIDNISNMVMLDAETNRSYKNAVFSRKRKTILQKDKAGFFIPQCTKNVFLKYYNDDVEQMSLWSKIDRERYVENIQTVLIEYLLKETR